MDDRRAATRERIVTAATTLISRYGFKRASVDAIAAEAGIAKPTLYAYFDDKDAIFRAVCESVLDAIVDDARRAAARDGPLDERVGAVLSAKFTRLYELVHATPHATEIIDSSDRIAHAIKERADRVYGALLEQVLADAVKRRELDLDAAQTSIRELVQSLLRCGHGAGYDATSAASHRRHVELLARLVLRAVRRGP